MTFWLVVAGCAAVAGLMAASTRSFWIDECVVAWQASAPSLKALWQALLAERTSDLQMPFYAAFIWGWEKLFGSGEWALRLANAPWYAVGVASLALASGTRLRLSVAAVLLACPFAWFLLDNARSYGMQMGLSMFVAAALLRLRPTGFEAVPHERGWLVAAAAGGLALSATSMMAMVFLGGFGLAWLSVTARRHVVALVKRQRPVVGAFLAALAGLGLYYLWTVKIGARGYSSGRPGVTSLLFAGYELCGFAGLGPGRHVLRSEGIRALPAFAPFLIGYGFFLTVTLLLGWRHLKELVSARVLWRVVVGLMAAAVFIFATAWAAGFRVQARHLTPLLGPLGLLLGAGLARLWNNPRLWTKALAVGFLVLSIASCASLRLAKRHDKEDYRGAAALGAAALANGQQVWWSAEPRGGLIYGLPVAENAQRGKALVVRNPGPDFFRGRPVPDVVIVSRADVYDVEGTLGAYLVEHGFIQVTNLTAFTAWGKPF